jgi:hypothetical protein
MVGAPGLNALRTVGWACAQVIPVACRARMAPEGIYWAAVTLAWRSHGIFMESWAPECTAAGVPQDAALGVGCTEARGSYRSGGKGRAGGKKAS